MLVYTSFCDKRGRRVWTGRGASTLFFSALGSVSLFYLVFWIVNGVSSACLHH